MEKEYRVEIKIRNNLILKFIEFKGYKTVGEFCRKNDLSEGEVGKLVNMKKSPINKSTGEFTDLVESLAIKLEVSPEQLFSEEQLYADVVSNKRSIEVSSAEARFMLEIGSDNSYCIEDKMQKYDLDKCIYSSLDKLLGRESNVLKLRFGLDGNSSHTLGEVAKIRGCTPERVRQIELKALRKLRHPSRSAPLKELMTGE